MPKWGLTDRQRETKPWGLPSELLAPCKVITDPVHEDIYVNEVERLLVDSPPLQRLRRVRQLGTSYLVYPAATHNRFSHALGTLRVAQDLLDAVADNRSGPRHTEDLLDEWAKDPDIGKVAKLDLCFAEATVLARLGGLLHDLCHVPLGHTIEDDLKVLTPHDANEERFDRLWKELDSRARSALEAGRSAAYPDGPPLKEELRRLIMSKVALPKDAPASSYPFVEDIVGNTICADLIDYLHRDHLFTGLPIAIGDRFVDDFYVMGSGHKHYAKKMVIRITRRGHPRSDVVTELVKNLRFRYELTERVLTHHTKIAADAMVGKLLEIWSDVVWLDIAKAKYQAETATVGHDDLDQLKQEIFAKHPDLLEKENPDLTSTDDPKLKRSAALAALDALVRKKLEDEFTSRSDDGLIEHLSRLDDGGDKRSTAVSRLARSVLDRRLFKLIGHAESAADLALADEKYRKFGSPSTRRRLETAAAKQAVLPHGWQAVVWLPNPNMRLKVAEVLVDNGQGVAPLDRVSEAGGQIVAQHRKLWSVSVFADLDVNNALQARKAQIVLSYLRDEMDLQLRDWNGELVKATQELAVDMVAELASLGRDKTAQLAELMPAAMGANETFQARLAEIWEAGVVNGLFAGAFPHELQLSAND